MAEIKNKWESVLSAGSKAVTSLRRYAAEQGSAYVDWLQDLASTFSGGTFRLGNSLWPNLSLMATPRVGTL